MWRQLGLVAKTVLVIWLLVACVVPEVGETLPTETEPVAAEAEATVEPKPEVQTVTVTGSVVDGRSGPGLQHEVLAQVQQGEDLPVIGISEDRQWLHVELVGEPHWIYADLTDLAAELRSALPIMASPVADTAGMGATPTPAAAQTAADRMAESRNYFDQGMAKLNEERYGEAIRDFDRSVQLRSDYYGAYIMRGVAKTHIQRHLEALQDFDEALRLVPADLQDATLASLYRRRALTKIELERSRGALPDFDEAIRLNPDEADSFYFRGRTKFHLELYGEAIPDFDAAIRLQPDHALAYAYRALAKGITGNLVAALADVEEAIRLDPDEPNSQALRKVLTRE